MLPQRNFRWNFLPRYTACTAGSSSLTLSCPWFFTLSDVQGGGKITPSLSSVVPRKKIPTAILMFSILVVLVLVLLVLVLVVLVLLLLV